MTPPELSTTPSGAGLSDFRVRRVQPSPLFGMYVASGLGTNLGDLYWGAMFIAGVFGTVFGDLIALRLRQVRSFPDRPDRRSRTAARCEFGLLG